MSCTLQKRQQQAKQAPHSSKLSVLDTHKLLKEHLRAVPSPPSPTPPGFHVGKRGKKGKTTVSLQVESIPAECSVLLHETCACPCCRKAHETDMLPERVVKETAGVCALSLHFLLIRFAE